MRKWNFGRTSVLLVSISAAIIGGAIYSGRSHAAGPQATAPQPGAAHTASVSIDFTHPGPAIGPMMYGLMTEEINHAYDGGLYAELIQNRCFKDDPKEPKHWSPVGHSKLVLDNSDPVNPALNVSLNVEITAPGDGVANDGFWGIPLKPDTTYKLSLYLKGNGGYTGTVSAQLAGPNGKSLASNRLSWIDDLPAKWHRVSVELQTGPDVKPTTEGRLIIGAADPGSFSISDVSLFPPTFNNRPNGDRIDITEKLAAMKPAFIRLPGGNFLEGDNFPNRFDWKKEIGPVDQRPGHMGCWSYRSSDGFGLPEFLNWCDDVHAEPLLAVFAGYTLQHDHVAAGPKLQPYVDEALQEIEYLTGDATTTWGKKRADDGHPAPFKLHYVEIGNEDWFDNSGSYDGRFAQFFDAIRAKYPDLKLIATMPVKSRKPDLVDDHYYRSARTMAFDAGHYDHAGRGGPHIFVGEWATQEGRPTPDLNAGLADAAWLMGLENDADLVEMTCYAPLLVNVNPGAWQWPTNLIGYDNLNSFGSPSYYAQVMINQNRGDYVVPTKAKVEETVMGAGPAPHGRIGVGTWHTDSEFKDIQVNGNGPKDDLQLMFTPDLTGGTKGWAFTRGKWAIKDGSIQPGKADAETWAMVGDPAWTDYTVTLKARKTAGKEGFLVLFRSTDANNYLWWNIGGWGNTRTQFEGTYDNAREAFGPESDFKVETGKWYDLKLEVKGHHFRGYVDGKLVSEADEKPVDVRTPFFAQSSYDKTAGELVLKVVNMSPDAVDAAFDLTGAEIGSTGKAVVLTGEPTDQNSLEEPTKIAPKEQAVTGLGAAFHRTFPAHSFTLIRIPAKVKG
jgi:alpha-N-arabinofuranosidase